MSAEDFVEADIMLNWVDIALLLGVYEEELLLRKGVYVEEERLELPLS